MLGARKLRIREVPVMVAAGWTKAQIQAYALADNKLALNAGWDACAARASGRLAPVHSTIPARLFVCAKSRP